jgi:cephalosporin-C deacetylase-like acetyl esterase
MRKSILILFLIHAFLTLTLFGQPSRELINVIVTPNYTDWTYEIGERAEFSITVLRNNVPLQEIEIQYTIGPEKMEAEQHGRIQFKGKPVTIKSNTFGEPGFLRCTATVELDGKKYSSYATAGFAPEKIKPTTTLPSDFEAFWDKGKQELAKIPISPILTLMPERCTAKVDVYHVQIDNIHGKIYGILCQPKKEGKYPAILHVPGAGIRPYYGNVDEAEKGFITFTIGIHGIPVNLDKDVYENLRNGALFRYHTFNLDNKDIAYYKRVYLGCVRSVDFIESLDSYNGNIAVTGGSQGGALSIVTAALDDRIDYLAALCPALCDVTGYLHGRAGGWPGWFRDENTNKTEKIETSKYFDVVNFARFVKVPGWYSWGYNDDICPPTSMYAAYNMIQAEKELQIFQETQHWQFPEQLDMKDEWLVKMLGK